VKSDDGFELPHPPRELLELGNWQRFADGEFLKDRGHGRWYRFPWGRTDGRGCCIQIRPRCSSDRRRGFHFGEGLGGYHYAAFHCLEAFFRTYPSSEVASDSRVVFL
jgi:hypothetical protein